jgi:thiol-disulfide isomerase/thioredoxin
MQTILFGTSWVLSTLVTIYVLIRFGVLDRRAETGGLSVGLRFPFSELDDAFGYWGTSTKPLVLLVANPGCGSCQPLLNVLGDVAEQYPEIQFLLLLREQIEQVTAMAVERNWSFPAFPFTVDHERALDIQAYPTVYAIGTDGRIIARENPHSIEEFLSLLAQVTGR